MEMVLNDHLIEGVKLLDGILGNYKAVLIKDGLIFVVNHLSLHILGKRIVRLSLSKHIHLVSDNLNILNVLN